MANVASRSEGFRAQAFLSDDERRTATYDQEECFAKLVTAEGQYAVGHPIVIFTENAQ